MTSWINLDALWKIVVVGLACGAGLPAVFAVGLRALGHAERVPSAAGPVSALAGGEPAEGVVPLGTRGGTGATRRPATGWLAIAAACACFAVVLAAIGCGIDLIVSHG